jgi:Cdc6-like AAA superfamily ATPase
MGGSMYVCGSPGLGKSLVVNSILNEIARNNIGIETSILTIRGQGTVMDSPYLHLVESNDSFDSNGLSEIKAKKMFYEKIKEKSSFKLLVIDEIDMIKQKSMLTELYRESEFSPLFIIGIANSIDFTASIGVDVDIEGSNHHKVLFEHYNYEDLYKVLDSRCYGLINNFAKTFLAKKIVKEDGLFDLLFLYYF